MAAKPGAEHPVTATTTETDSGSGSEDLASGIRHPVSGWVKVSLPVMAAASLWLYRVLFHALLPLAVPLLWLRDRVGGKSRPPLRARLVPEIPAIEPGGIWIQAVSVGEVELGRRLVRELRDRQWEPPVVVSVTTATGLALARRTVTDAATVTTCPLDLPGAVSRVFDLVRPQLLVLVETELWPELMHQASSRGIPVAVVNGRLSESSVNRYRRLGRIMAPLLEPLSLILVRDPSDAVRFASLGIPEHRIQVTGNIKYDLEPDPAPLPWGTRVRALAGGRPVLVAGSTMDGEESLVLDAVEAAGKRGPAPFVIMAPRHPERFASVAELLDRRGVEFVRRSEQMADTETADVFLLDTIGELARAYQMGSLAFIGGSLVATGGHNPLEPAVWGIPVVSGCHVFNFQEVYDEMVAAGGARLAADCAGLASAIADWLADPASARAAGDAGRAVVERNRGATARTVDALLALVDSGPSD